MAVPLNRPSGQALLFGFALLAASLGAAAMSFHADPPYLYLAGGVVKTDWDAWQEAMKRYDGKITTVVFDRSPGGHSITGRKIGEDIRKRSLTTVVAARCVSACANMFLGGTTRLFASKQTEPKTLLGFHGTYNKTTHALAKDRPPDYFLAMTQGRMSEELVNRFTSIENRQGFLYFAHPGLRENDRAPLAYFCKGTENAKQREEKCERMNDVDALKVGVVTSWDAAKVPASPKRASTKGTAKNWN